MAPPEHIIDDGSDEQETLVRLLDRVPNAVLLIDEDGRILRANRPAELLFDYADGELAGCAVEELIPDRFAIEHRRRRAAFHEAPVERIMGVDHDLWARRRDGSEFPAEVVLKPWVASSGTVVVASVADVTARRARAERAGAAERRLRRVLDGLFGFVGLYTLDGYLLEANEAPLAAAGLTREDVIGRPFWKTYWWSYSEEAQRQLQAALARAASGETVRYEVPVQVRDGAMIMIDVMFGPLHGEDGSIENILGFGVDVTQRVEAEQRLRASEARLKLVFENTTDMQCLYHVEEGGRLVGEALNPAYLEAARAVGMRVSEAEFVGKEREETLRAWGFSGELVDAESERMRRVLRSGRGETTVEVVPTPIGPREAEISLTPVLAEDGRPTHLLWSARDITERRAAERAVEASLREKEVLLREMHHRVKNNLQVISSLVELQARRVSSPEVRDILSQTSDRVRSMALVHERLYESDDFARIDFGEYLRALATSVEASHARPGGGIELDLRLDRVLMSVGTAVPCGLIVNELVTNALQHAFPDGKGTVRVSLRARGEDVELEVADDGIGMDPAVVWARQSLGLTIVRTLAEQVGGELLVEGEGGARFTLRCHGAAHHDGGAPRQGSRDGSR